MPLVQEKEAQHYTYADVLTWDGGERYELFDGEAALMAPPNRMHQKILMELAAQLHAFSKGTACEVYPAPFGVRLFPREDNSDDTFFEPDITVVCDPAKLDDQGCRGAPDLVVEILSPASVKHDFLYKFNKYREAGVREYWIVNPNEKILQVYILDGDTYRVFSYDSGDMTPVSVLPGCQIDLKAVFAD
ncbi:MAG: Uma2 family endonuclease [Treponema sp.]|jgi:Uma2 family endonuclease|nr:Uma2 family endonuclease [Treponema sp.]